MNSASTVCDDHESLSRQAAGRIVNALARKPDLLLCAAGGSTPVRTYELLAAHHQRAPEVFTSLRVIKLDEWGGLTMDDRGSCENQLRANLILPLRVSADRYSGFNSNPADPATGSFTVTLHPMAGSDTVIVFNKGQTSSGGTISVAGGAVVNLRTSVQPVSYTDSGIVWQ